jgi:hypothetical protein
MRLKLTAVLVLLAFMYGCGGTSTASSSSTTSSSTTSSTTSNTDSLDCTYSETTANSSAGFTSKSAWSCSTTERSLSANGIPDHAVGTFPNPNNPNSIAEQTVSWYTSLTPANTGTSTSVAPSGYALNGVKFDPSTAGSCPSDATSTSECTLLGNTGTWTIEALGQTSFDFGLDTNNAHVQPNGAYHYHGIPTGILTNNGDTGQKMLLVGWAADGFPIYARWGYSVATDATSAIKVIKGSYELKSTPDSGRPSTSVIPMGAFTQDYEYVAGSGDLDACNGRTGVTPEFPNGIYHYYITDTYPFIQRCAYGKVLDAGTEGAQPAERTTRRSNRKSGAASLN